MLVRSRPGIGSRAVFTKSTHLKSKWCMKKLNVSQNEFALMIGVSVRTLQNWEQGRRKPEGPAKALLKVASKNPSAVLDAIHTEDAADT
jgi:putative transcriptional regulator